MTGKQITRMQSLRDKGKSYRAIATTIGCSPSTVSRYIREHKHTPDPFAVQTGRQVSVDTARLLTVDRNTFWSRLDRWQKLTLFDTIYHTQELATGAVNIISRFTNSRMIPRVDNPEIAKRMTEIWNDLDLHNVNAQLIRQSLIYGFSIAEWVSQKLDKMDRVVVVPSLEVRKITDRQGQIQSYVQLPGFLVGRPVSLDGRQPIPPQKVISLVRDPLHTFGSQVYGNSLFESAIDQFESLCQILQAEVSVMLRLGKPRFQVNIPAEGLSPEQFQERIDLTKTAFTHLGELDSADLYVPTGVDVKIIGAESFGQRFADETRLVISNILAAVGIPPGLIHVSISGSGASESYLRQATISMQTMIDEIQRSLASAWNNSFWKMVQRMERMPTAPVMGFEKPRLLEQSIEETARDLRFKNDLREVVFGIRPLEWLVQRVGATSADDIAALQEQVENARATFDPQETTTQGAENSADSNTKVTDERATNNKTI